MFFFFSSRRRHTRSDRDWSSDVCSSDLVRGAGGGLCRLQEGGIRAPVRKGPRRAARHRRGGGRRRRDPAGAHLHREGESLGGNQDRKSTRLNSSHDQISYAVFCLKKKKKNHRTCTSA